MQKDHWKPKFKKRVSKRRERVLHHEYKGGAHIDGVQIKYKESTDQTIASIRKMFRAGFIEHFVRGIRQ